LKALNPEMGFATNLGVVVNMREGNSTTEAEYHAWLRDNRENNCFEQAVPRSAALQDAARFQTIRADRKSMDLKPAEPVGGRVTSPQETGTGDGELNV